LDTTVGALRLLGDFAPTGGEAAFQQLAGRLRREIVAGILPPGSRLPSERSIAAAVGVSRSTVVAALDLLRGEGFVESRQGSGTRVRFVGPRDAAPGHAGLVIDLGNTVIRPAGFVVDELLELERGEAMELVQMSEYSRSGLRQLRVAVASYYAEFGLRTDPDALFITTGVQQALRLALRVVTEPGANVLLEEPSFAGAAETLRERNLRVTPVPRGRDGLDLDALERAFAITRARLLVIQPACHMPTGTTMPISDRRDLLRICSRHQATVIENASWNDATFAGEPEPPIAALSPKVRTVTIGSANTLFWDGLSVAWVRTDPQTTARMTSAISPGDFRASIISQHATARLLRHVDASRKARRIDLRANYESLAAELRSSVPEWTFHEPAGGAALWVTLPTSGATALSRTAMWSGVTAPPGTSFSSVHALDEHLQFGFATPFAQVAPAVRTFVDVWRTHSTN
jgi:DNA-binding transcriptional MocR family regulator